MRRRVLRLVNGGEGGDIGDLLNIFWDLFVACSTVECARVRQCKWRNKAQ